MKCEVIDILTLCAFTGIILIIRGDLDNLLGFLQVN